MKFLVVLSFFGVLFISDFHFLHPSRSDPSRYVVDHVEVLRILDTELTHIINK